MRIPLAVFAAASVLALAACAPVNSSPGLGVDELEVVGQGTVIQVADATPQLCLGAVAESYPPQCSGPEITGWDWSTAEGQETASDVTWGTYAVWGVWDGTTLAVTSQIQLALYDPIRTVDPFEDPANAGESSEDELLAIQAELYTDAPVQILFSSVHNGYLFVTVEFDDGSVQSWADETYGVDVVQVRSALNPIPVVEE